MRWIPLLLALFCLGSCWNLGTDNYYSPDPPLPRNKVWGLKPVYKAKRDAKTIQYTAQKQPLLLAGNIYAFGHYIFQVDVGSGIHVIDNTNPSAADRIGFISVHGCSQVSIKGSYLYTNSLDDLVTLDISDPARLREVSRVAGAFPELAYLYPMVEPTEKGYYTCPRYDSVVVGWVKDSIWASCQKL